MVKAWLIKNRDELEDDIQSEIGYGYDKFLEDNLQEVIQLFRDYTKDELEYNTVNE